ncbi:MAG: DUF1844 domain-containing protein [Pseudomonadota bacterium]
MSDEDKGFVIKDRRRFSPAGEAMDHDEEGSKEARGPKAESAPGRGQGEDASAADPGRAQRRSYAPLPEVTFSTFVFSLGTSALLHLGELADPNTKETHPDLTLAKQTIDILGMLQHKTVGNLDGEEENLLNNLLYELRLKYVAAIKK